MDKLLILGGNPTEIEIVERAKKLGLYTIVTDNHTDWKLSPAKQLADEGWNISWSDVGSLTKKCQKENVGGVIAGFSEFRVDNMIQLCDRLHFPCSLTMHQLDVTRDKLLFKETCRKYGLNTIAEHHINDSNITFPVIVKPVDRAGSIGINVAYNKEDLGDYYETALSLSPSKQAVIEDFITDGIKVDVYYYVKDNRITFLGSSDTVMCKGDLGAKILQKAWPFKSKYEHDYLKQVDGKVRDMFKGLAINNAYATMSMFYRNGDFYFFEAGFRLSGEMSYHYYEKIAGINYLDSMIKLSMRYNDPTVFKEVHNSNNHCIVLNFFGLDGYVDSIKGLEELKQNDSIYDIQLYVSKDDVIENSTNVFKKIAMFTIVAASFEDMVATVNAINNTFDVFDKNGESLVYERVSEQELYNS